MYLPAHFADESPAFARAFIESHPFAQLITLTGGGLVATGLPVLYRDAHDGTPAALVGHVARANRQWRDALPDVESLVIFGGADGYVSPNWYPSKHENPRVVPTWNYETVHVRGRLEIHDDPGWTLDVVRALTDRHEAVNPVPWSVDDAPRDYIDSMLRAIVGVSVAITGIEAKRKLSQNRDARDAAGVVGALEMLAASPPPRSVAGSSAKHTELATSMRDLQRPPQT